MKNTVIGLVLGMACNGAVAWADLYTPRYEGEYMQGSWTTYDTEKRGLEVAHQKTLPVESGSIVFMTLNAVYEKYWVLHEKWLVCVQGQYSPNWGTYVFNSHPHYTGVRSRALHSVKVRLASGAELSALPGELASQGYSLDKEGLTRTNDRIKPRPEIKESILAVAKLRLDPEELRRLEDQIDQAESREKAKTEKMDRLQEKLQESPRFDGR